MTNNSKDIVRNRIVPILIYVGLIMVISAFITGFVQSDISMRPSQDMTNDQYSIAERQINSGEMDRALATYSKIINSDSSEETAWHEKGKLLIRIGYCNEAMNHYYNYDYRFPKSQRANEGYELAKQC